MIRVFQSWWVNYFSDEDAIIFFILLLSLFLGIVFLGEMLAPVLIGLVFAFLLQSFVKQFKKWGVPHLVSVWLTFCFFVALFTVTIVFFIPLVWAQILGLINEFPNMIKSGHHILRALPEQYPYWLSNEQANQLIINTITVLNQQITSLGQIVVSFSISRVPVLINILIYSVLVPILVFFFLKDQKILMSWLSDILPKKRRVLNQVATEMSDQIANYIRGKFIEILIVGFCTYIAFFMLGLIYPALLSFLVGLSVLVPYIGAAVVTIPVVLIALFQWGWGDQFFLLLLVYAIIQAIDGNLLVPLLFSEVVNLHPIAIIVSVLLFGGIWGFWGVFFAIPLATLVKAIINAWPKQNFGQAVQ